MNSYDELITLIDSCINRNGVQAITGQVLNGVLKAMVNQLGAGYALGGVAHPSDDPGLPEEPVCYFASEVGTYTDFGGVSIVAGELALLCYDLTDGWRKETMYEGFASVGATIDGNVGTPSVDVTYNNGVLSFDFRNLKGNPGEDGDDGAAAGFGTIGATVDGNVGTPSVSVQESGPNTAKNLQFNFSNLKGETGVTSVVVTVDNTVGTPQCAVSLSGQELTLAFTGLKGAQGDTGSSVDYPFTIVNNLTTNDATQALSAAMGVQLESELTQLEAEVNGLFGYADADLDIADENGNVLARFEDGDFRVKNFDSAKAPQQGDTTPDFAIIDENWRAIVVFRDGNIQTKNFDSETFGKEWFVGKKVSIIGDSISTAPNHNAVEFTVLDSDISQGRTLQGYPTYYDIGTTIGGVAVTSGMVGVLTSFSPVAGDEGKTIGKPQNYNTAGTSGVSSYTETWWYKMATALGMEVLQNVSWSGASISSHEGNANDYKTSYAWHPAQINKLATRDAGGNTIKPDVVIIYRGTNDMTHSPYTSLTDFGADAMSIPDTDYSDSSYDFKVAYCMTIKKIREAYPQAKIIVCTLNLFKRLNDTQFPTNNGYNTLPEYNNAIREVANMMGCGLIEFDKDGITFENCYPTYISDNATHPTHPNPTGHTRMAEKAIIDIKNY